MSAIGGPVSYNVDSPDGIEDEPEAFNPDYASLPAMRPAQPPQYRPTPHYPSDSESQTSNTHTHTHTHTHTLYSLAS